MFLPLCLFKCLFSSLIIYSFFCLISDSFRQIQPVSCLCSSFVQPLKTVSSFFFFLLNRFRRFCVSSSALTDSDSLVILLHFQQIQTVFLRLHRLCKCLCFYLILDCFFRLADLDSFFLLFAKVDVSPNPKQFILFAASSRLSLSLLLSLLLCKGLFFFPTTSVFSSMVLASLFVYAHVCFLSTSSTILSVQTFRLFLSSSSRMQRFVLLPTINSFFCFKGSGSYLISLLLLLLL